MFYRGASQLHKRLHIHAPEADQLHNYIIGINYVGDPLLIVSPHRRRAKAWFKAWCR